MVSKRIIGTLTVKDGRVVKSYGYRAWRPAGDLFTALRNLDRWATDEILVLDISRRPGLDPRVVEQIRAARVSTPLSYGGGIREERQIETLMALGCDRFVLESVLFDDPAAVRRLADVAGEQALIGSVPLLPTKSGWRVWRPSGGNHELDGDTAIREFLGAQPISEYFITAVESEGRAGLFPTPLLKALGDLPNRSVIWFGGLDADTAIECLRSPITAAVAFGNSLHESELALPNLRRAINLATSTLRPARLLS